MFPLRAREGGVLVRDGHTEASLDLCRLAGLPECALLSEIVTADSTGMARMPELVEFSKTHKLVSVLCVFFLVLTFYVCLLVGWLAGCGGRDCR